MSKLPAFFFYPKDWLCDVQLRMCSQAARGVWIDLLCVMFNASNRGVLDNPDGTPWSDEEICGAIAGGTGANLKFLAELLEKGVASRNSRGAVFSRRMVRDEQERQADRKRMNRFREKGGGDPERWTAIRIPILERDGYMCAYCGRKATTVDHVIPKSKGGNEDAANLVACCKRCNNKKSNRTPEEAGMSFWPAFLEGRLKRQINVDITSISHQTSEDANANANANGIEVITSNSKAKSSFDVGIDEATSRVFLELGLAGNEARMLCHDAVKSFVHQSNCSFSDAAESLVSLWKKYQLTKTDYKKGVRKFLADGEWRNPDAWKSKLERFLEDA